jgi:hypothetical protein
MKTKCGTNKEKERILRTLDKKLKVQKRILGVQEQAVADWLRS